MSLLWLLIVPLLGGILAWLGERWERDLPRWIALAALAIDLGLVMALLSTPASEAIADPWLVQLKGAWIPRFNIAFQLGLDGLSLALIALTVFLGIVSVVVSWSEIREKTGFFHFNLLWTLTGVMGVFLALDLFLFFLFWELMLVPMYFLISVWGHEQRAAAAIKFFIFTQASGLFLLLAILALVLVHRQHTGLYTFDYFELLGTPLNPSTARWIMLGFLVAFAVKLPVVPLHTWLPDAHTQAPTAGSVILAGLLLKTGAYGLLRLVIPLFPGAAFHITPVMMLLAVVGILYGALLAFAQTDLKRLVAYTSISHLGFVLLGIFAWNPWALQGAVVQMLAHGISTGALFILAGLLQERLHTREMGQMGGLWSSAPRMGAIALFFAIAALGLPGLGNFIGEFLVLLGAYRVNIGMTVAAALGLVTAVVYALILVQKTFHGANREVSIGNDLNLREMTVMGILIIALAGLGLHPQPLLDTTQPALDNLRQSAENALATMGGGT